MNVSDLILVITAVVVLSIALALHVGWLRKKL